MQNGHLRSRLSLITKPTEAAPRSRHSRSFLSAQGSLLASSLYPLLPNKVLSFKTLIWTSNWLCCKQGREMCFLQIDAKCHSSIHRVTSRVREQGYACASLLSSNPVAEYWPCPHHAHLGHSYPFRVCADELYLHSWAGGNLRYPLLASVQIS